MIKRISVILLVGLLIISVVACGKKDNTSSDNSSVTSDSGTGNTSSTPAYDDADNMTSSEFEKIESDFVNNTEIEIEITGSSNASSSNTQSSSNSSSDSGESSETQSSGTQTSSDDGYTKFY